MTYKKPCIHCGSMDLYEVGIDPGWNFPLIECLSCGNQFVTCNKLGTYPQYYTSENIKNYRFPQQ